MRTRQGLAIMLALSLMPALWLATGCGGSPAERESTLVSSAERYEQAGEYGKAIIEYRNALKIEPHSAEIEYSLGRAYLKNRQSQEAFLAYQKSHELDPDYIPSELAIGQYNLMSLKFGDAQKIAQSVLRKAPTNAEAQIMLADADAGMKNLAAGTEVLEKLTQSAPGYVPGYLNLGLFLMARGQNDAAQRQFEKAVSVDPNSVEARKALGGYFVLQNDSAKAEIQYRAAVNANPDSTDAVQALAAFYAQQHRFQDAEPLYKTLVRLKKNSAEARFSLANFYLRQGRTADVATVDREIAKDTPDFLPARLQLAELAIRDRDYGAADDVLNKILKGRPKEPRALLLAAQVSVGRNQPQTAIQQLETAQRSDPDNPVLNYWKGMAYRETGDLDRAQHSLELAIARNQHYTDAQILLAKLMLDRGLADSARQYAQMASVQEPQRAECYLLLGIAETGLRDFPAAEKALQVYTRMNPQSSEGPVRLGAAYLMQHRYPGAEEDFEKALAINPKQDDALNGLVTIDHVQGRDEAAVARVRKQIGVADTADIENVLAKLYLDLGRPQDAQPVLSHALVLDPRNYNTHALLSTMYVQEKLLDKAATELQNAAGINPREIGAWTTLGIVETQRGDTQQAKYAYEKALGIDPNAALAASNLAMIDCQTGGDLDNALDLARRARQTLPNSPLTSDTLGWVYFKRSLYQSALPLLQEAVRNDPRNGEFRFHLAASLLALGRKQQARTELQTALELDKALDQRPDVLKMMGALKKG